MKSFAISLLVLHDRESSFRLKINIFCNLQIYQFEFWNVILFFCVWGGEGAVGVFVNVNIFFCVSVWMYFFLSV